MLWLNVSFLGGGGRKNVSVGKAGIEPLTARYLNLSVMVSSVTLTATIRDTTVREKCLSKCHGLRLNNSEWRDTCRREVGLLIRQGFLVHLSCGCIVKKKVGTTTTIYNHLPVFLMTQNKSN